MNYSVSEENYIKAIFHLQQEDGTVTTSELARRLSARPASITDMMKKLKAKKLVNYRPYYGFRLTTEGKKLAITIIRRHRLWEYFLAEKLNFSWEEVHEVAEQLEHIRSGRLIEKLDRFLGYPKFDPHGDPIPDVHGKMESSAQQNLLAFPENKTAVVCRVINQSPEMLELLHHKKIGIGTQLEIKKKFAFDNSLEIKTGRQPAFIISEQLGKNIFVKK